MVALMLTFDSARGGVPAAVSNKLAEGEFI